MSLINAHNLSMAFGPVDLFSGISFSVPPRGRIAIVGPNGIGKTTLLKILAGKERQTGGTVSKSKKISMGYLPQVAEYDSGNTLWQECLQSFGDIIQQENKLSKLETEISLNPDHKDLLAQYGNLQEAFELAGGYTYQLQIEQALTGLGFKKEDFEFPINKLSGGQKTRARLAKLLLSRPDLLILDEPTNHLDIQAVEWLEGFLKDWDGAVLIVSHDRYFLDRVITHIWEMSSVGFELYRGNYTAYIQTREQRWAERMQYIETEFAVMYRELDYIRRNIAGQRTVQAKGKLRRLSRQIRAIEKFGFVAIRGKNWGEIGTAANPFRVEEAFRHLSALAAPNHSHSPIKVQIRAKGRSGNIVLRGQDLEIGYPTKSLFTVEEFELRRLSCVALIGPNGSGKTTFLKTILGQLEPLDGSLELGASLKVGYFAQAHEELLPELTLIEEIERVKPGMLEAEIRKHLGAYRFSGDDHYKKVLVLSGGERGRLALAKLALLDANVLLLDEPTNHLDIPSQEVLQNVIAEFNGTVILVSHDRYLIDALTNQIWLIDANEKNLIIHKGSYTDYKQRLEKSKEAALPVKEVIEIQVEKQTPPKKMSWKVQQRLKKLEYLIEAREKSLEEISRILENPPEDLEKVKELGMDFMLAEKDLDDAMQEWEKLHS